MDYLIFLGLMLYASGAGVITAAVATRWRPRPPWHRATAAALATALWPLALPVWAAWRAYRRHRPHTAARPVDAGPGLPPTQPCTEHHGNDRLRYGCSGPDPDGVEPLLTDHSPRDLDPLSRALHADVVRHLRPRPQPYATALARLLNAVDRLRADSAPDPSLPGHRVARAQLFDDLYLTAEHARMLVTDEPEDGRG